MGNFKFNLRVPFKSHLNTYPNMESKQELVKDKNLILKKFQNLLKHKKLEDMLPPNTQVLMIDKRLSILDVMEIMT